MNSTIQFAAGFLTGIAIMAAIGLAALATGSTALLAGIVPLGIAVSTAYVVGGLIKEGLERESAMQQAPTTSQHRPSTAH